MSGGRNRPRGLENLYGQIKQKSGYPLGFCRKDRKGTIYASNGNE